MPQKNWINVESKRIAAVDYEPTMQRLFVKFHKDRNNQQAVYEYSNVPAATFEMLMSAPSKGKFMNEVIISDKQKFPYQKIGYEAAPPEEPTAERIAKRSDYGTRTKS